MDKYIIPCFNAPHHPNLKWQQYSEYSRIIKCLKTGTSSLNHLWPTEQNPAVFLHFSQIKVYCISYVTREWAAKVGYFWRIVLEFIVLENDEAQSVHNELAKLQNSVFLYLTKEKAIPIKNRTLSQISAHSPHTLCMNSHTKRFLYFPSTG